jgi:hypothetical protein
MGVQATRVGNYDQLINDMLASDAQLSADLREKLGARVLLALLFQEASSAVLSARARGVQIELTERLGTDAFTITSGFANVYFERTPEGIAVKVWGYPGLGLSEVLKPEPSADRMGAQAIGAVKKALAFFVVAK